MTDTAAFIPGGELTDDREREKGHGGEEWKMNGGEDSKLHGLIGLGLFLELGLFLSI